MKIPRTEKEIEIARAAARDGGNASMKKNNRNTWNQEDYNAAVKIFNTLSAMKTN